MINPEEIKSAIRDVPDYPKPGVIFRDITPLLSDARLFKQVVKAMAALYRDKRVDAIAGIEARGLIFGSAVAHELGCGFVPIRKAGKLPFQTRSQQYNLEYGTAVIEVHTDAFRPGDRVVIHDDVLATGGTARAAGELVTSSGAELVAFSFLIHLSFLPGIDALTGFNVPTDFFIKY